MRKFLPYILIAVVLVVIFSPVPQAQAEIPQAAVGKLCDSTSSDGKNSSQGFSCESPPNWAIGENCDVENTTPVVRFICQLPSPSSGFDPSQGTCFAIDLNTKQRSGSFPCGNPPQPWVGKTCVMTTPLRVQFTCIDPASATPKLNPYQDCVQANQDAGENINVCSGLAGDTRYTLLAPLPGLEEPIDVSGSNALGKYLNIIIKLVIGLAAVLAMLMIVTGGIQYMTSELVSSKEAGKHRITNAILGLLIALGSYVLLFTINPDLLNTNVEIAPTKIIYEDIPQLPINGRYGAYDIGADWAQIAGAVVSLPAGVTLNAPECVRVGDRNCTSTRGLNLSIINAIKAGCPNCQLVITGGTEFWLHSVDTTHRAGNSTVDLRVTNDLNTFITGKSTFPNDGKIYVKGGIKYYAEPAGGSSTAGHWHVFQETGYTGSGAGGSF